MKLPEPSRAEPERHKRREEIGHGSQSCLRRRANNNIARMTPRNPPWKDMPPSQT